MVYCGSNSDELLEGKSEGLFQLGCAQEQFFIEPVVKFLVLLVANMQKRAAILSNQFGELVRRGFRFRHERETAYEYCFRGRVMKDLNTFLRGIGGTWGDGGAGTTGQRHCCNDFYGDRSAFKFWLLISGAFRDHLSLPH